MKWLGLHTSDIAKLPEMYLQPLSLKGQKELQSLASQESLTEEYRCELGRMLERKVKVELGTCFELYC